MTKKIDKNPEKTIEFDPDKCSALLEELIKAFQTHKPTAGEIIVAYGNLGYTLGAAIEGYENKGPDLKELEKRYLANSCTVGEALMFQGIITTSWFQSHKEETIKESQD